MPSAIGGSTTTSAGSAGTVAGVASSTGSRTVDGRGRHRCGAQLRAAPRAGMPPATTPGGIEPSTMLPAVTTEPAPMRAPGITVTRLAIHAPSSMTIGEGVRPSGPCSPSAKMQYGPMLTWSPTVISPVTSNSVEKLIAVREPMIKRAPGAVRSSIRPYSHVRRVRVPSSMRPSLAMIGRPDVTRVHRPTTSHCRRSGLLRRTW